MIKKTSKKEILNAIEDDIVVYLRSGNLSCKNIFSNLDLNINELDKLLNIHFLLDERVKKYLMNLNDNIKKINTSIINQEVLSQNSIKGNISWNKTIQSRSNINPKDSSIFVCNENIKNYNTKENIILKFFLKNIYKILKSINYDKYNYDWFNEWKKIEKVIEKIYIKNVYLSKINLKNIKIDNRMIESVSRNRNKLYSQAAKLLKLYNKIMSLDENEIRNMLKNTFIEIANEDTLFELYWIFKIIKDNSHNRKLYMLDEKNNKVAEWQNNDLTYTIYHNSSGSNEINFNVKVDELRNINHIFIQKQIKVIEDTNLLAKQLFDNINERYNSIFNGRPDILIEIREFSTNKLIKIIIGEVKHTIDKDYSIKGLKELMEYINFIKKNYINGYQYIEKDVEVKGILFLDNIKTNALVNETIKVITMFDKNKKIDIDFF